MEQETPSILEFNKGQKTDTVNCLPAKELTDLWYLDRKALARLSQCVAYEYLR